MRLLVYEGYNLTIDPMALSLKPLKTIWNRDKTEKKERAISEIAYIYFMEDPRSDYQYIIDREERSKAIKEGEGLKSTWQPDATIKEAMKLYASFKTSSNSFLVIRILPFLSSVKILILILYYIQTPLP